MPQNFYEILGVSPKASMQEVNLAYKRRLGQLVHRKHEAERNGASLVALLREERNLREAVDALTNNKRRRQYDIFREASDFGFPVEVDQLWGQAQTAMIDQTVLDSLRLLASLTRLPLQELSLLQSSKPKNYEEAKTVPRVENIGPLRSKEQHKQMLTSIPKKQSPTISEQRIEEKPATFSRRKPETSSTLPEKSKKAPKFTLEELAKKYGHDGRFLKAVREARGYSIAQVSQLTRITPNYIMAIEQNAFAKLPASTYVKGYIKSLARTLEIEDRAVVEDFMMLFEQRRS